MPLLLRPAQTTDLEACWTHVRRIIDENRPENGPIFAPCDGPWERTFEEFTKQCTTRWPKPVTEPQWERSWVLANDAEGLIGGQVKLVHVDGLRTSLHRATLMMGLERPYRRQGWGRRMLETALGWAAQQPSLDWVQLNVFADNAAARKLYRRFGFQEQGVTPDLFRVRGQKIDDIQMSIELSAIR